MDSHKFPKEASNTLIRRLRESIGGQESIENAIKKAQNNKPDHSNHPPKLRHSNQENDYLPPFGTKDRHDSELENEFTVRTPSPKYDAYKTTQILDVEDYKKRNDLTVEPGQNPWKPNFGLGTTVVQGDETLEDLDSVPEQRQDTPPTYTTITGFTSWRPANEVKSTPSTAEKQSQNPSTQPTLDNFNLAIPLPLPVRNFSSKSKPLSPQFSNSNLTNNDDDERSLYNNEKYEKVKIRQKDKIRLGLLGFILGSILGVLLTIALSNVYKNNEKQIQRLPSNCTCDNTTYILLVDNLRSSLSSANLEKSECEQKALQTEKTLDECLRRSIVTEAAVSPLTILPATEPMDDMPLTTPSEVTTNAPSTTTAEPTVNVPSITPSELIIERSSTTTVISNEVASTVQEQEITTGSIYEITTFSISTENSKGEVDDDTIRKSPITDYDTGTVPSNNFETTQTTESGLTTGMEEEQMTSSVVSSENPTTTTSGTNTDITVEIEPTTEIVDESLTTIAEFSTTELVISSTQSVEIATEETATVPTVQIESLIKGTSTTTEQQNLLTENIIPTEATSENELTTTKVEEEGERSEMSIQSTTDPPGNGDTESSTAIETTSVNKISTTELVTVSETSPANFEASPQNEVKAVPAGNEIVEPESTRTTPSEMPSDNKNLISSSQNPRKGKSGENLIDEDPGSRNKNGVAVSKKKKNPKSWFHRFLEVVKDVVSAATPFKINSKKDGSLHISVD